MIQINQNIIMYHEMAMVLVLNATFNIMSVISWRYNEL
jgi:hypothetical protein